MEVEEVAEVEDVEDEDSAEESRFARKVASFGMAVGSYYTPFGRMNSEEFWTTGALPWPAFIHMAEGWLHTDFILLSHTIHNSKLTSPSVHLPRSEMYMCFSQPRSTSRRPAGLMHGVSFTGSHIREN